ncbi:calcium-binding protein [Mesorhizobium sp. AaZ16]|uniref:calcium-binding protein n=1 Tax=Mesorhizobium sp. AaZ16 TaxID=3402289 RepID=UPI00374EB52E
MDIIGTPGNDTLNGTIEDDLIAGGEGNDLLRGLFGDDLIAGNQGDDLIVGGPGSDDLFGSQPIFGEDEGFDTLSYRDSFFSVQIDLQEGTASGGDAEGDRFAGFEGVEGSQDSDTLWGDADVNRLTGWDGDDVLSGRGGADTLRGGDGDDTLAGGAGADVLDGGYGTDVAWYFDAAAGVTADLLAPAPKTGDAVGDTYVSIEGLGGSFFADILYGNNSANTIYGGNGFFDAGNDRLFGRGGDDTIAGYGGDDTLDGGTGADQLDGGIGNDTYFVDSFGDKVFEANGVGTGVDTVRTSVNYSVVSQFVENMVLLGSGSINAVGNNLANVITGNSGNNAIDGRGGADTMQGGSGNDTYYVDNSGDVVRLCRTVCRKPDDGRLSQYHHNRQQPRQHHHRQQRQQRVYRARGYGHPHRRAGQ